MHPVDRVATAGSEATPSHKDRRDYARFEPSGLACDESDGFRPSAMRSLGWLRRRRCLAPAQGVRWVRPLLPRKLNGAALPVADGEGPPDPSHRIPPESAACLRQKPCHWPEDDPPEWLERNTAS